MVMDGDVEGSGVRQALIQGKKIGRCDDKHGKGSIGVVLLSTFVAVCGSFEFGLCVGYSAPTQAALIKELHLSLAEFSLFGAILNIGAAIGAATSGPLADLNGRKWTLGISAAICIGAWIMVFFSKTAWSLDVGRCLSGYGIGVISYVVPVFIAEITPKNIRGTLTTINQLLICSGVSFGMIVGTFVSWRTLALTGTVPCVILILGLLFIPESPRWLAKVGRDQDFEDALQRLRGKDADPSEEAVEILESVESLESLPKARIGDLFQKRYARSVIVGVGLILLQQCGGINGFAFYISDIFLSAGFSSSNLGTIAYAAVQIPFTALGAVITDKSGRRPLLLVSATGTFIGSFLTGVSFYLKEHHAALTWSPYLALIGVLFYISSFSLGMGAIPWVIMSEIFALNIKGIAGSTVTFVHWVAAWLIAYAFNFLILWSASGTFFIFAGFCAATIIFIAKLVPETKGRTLEEIQASMNSIG